MQLAALDQDRQRFRMLAILCGAVGGAAVLYGFYVIFSVVSAQDGDHLLQDASQAIAAFFVAVGALALVMQAWEKLQRREYERMLLDFHWREDMSPVEFEQACADYLGLHGWKTTNTPGSGDQGADVIARKGGYVLILQCKKYNKAIGNRAVQEAISAKVYYQATHAAVVATKNYTPAAKALAQKAGVLLLHFTELKEIDHRLDRP